MTPARFAPPRRRLEIASKRIAVVASGILVSAILVFALLLPARGAWPEGNAKAGLRLAQRWCASCHVVDAAGHGSDAAPPFPTIAGRRHRNPSWLRAWLSSPHPHMPDVHLSNKEISDVVAYLRRLAHAKRPSV
jgi:mono/diheme cytochrome c family protein